MEIHETEQKQGEAYLSAYEALIGDERTRKMFNGIIYGIIGAESLRASQIARFSHWDGRGEPFSRGDVSKMRRIPRIT